VVVWLRELEVGGGGGGRRGWVVLAEPDEPEPGLSSSLLLTQKRPYMAESPEKAAAAAKREVVRAGMGMLKREARHCSLPCSYEDPEIRIRCKRRTAPQNRTMRTFRALRGTLLAPFREMKHSTLVRVERRSRHLEILHRSCHGENGRWKLE
jgi:hypothetical protein